MAHGQQRDLVVEVDEALDDHAAARRRARAACAYSHAALDVAAASRTTDWPLPEEDITGLTTHGVPSAATASRELVLGRRRSGSGEVGRPSSSAASRRMPSRSIVSRAARAVGTTCKPSASSSSSTAVAIASISGTTTAGRPARSTRAPRAARRRRACRSRGAVRDLHRRRVGVAVDGDHLAPEPLRLDRDLLPSSPEPSSTRRTAVPVSGGPGAKLTIAEPTRALPVAHARPDATTRDGGVDRPSPCLARSWRPTGLPSNRRRPGCGSLVNRPQDPAGPPAGLVSPPVAPALDVVARILAEIGRAEDEDLEALRPGLVASPRAGRDAHHVPLLDLDDLVVELHPPAPAHDHVHLLLLLVRVAEREAIAGRDALVAQAGLLKLERLVAGRNSRSGAPSKLDPKSSRSSLRFLSVNGTAAILLLGLQGLDALARRPVAARQRQEARESRSRGRSAMPGCLPSPAASTAAGRC